MDFINIKSWQVSKEFLLCLQWFLYHFNFVSLLHFYSCFHTITLPIYNVLGLFEHWCCISPEIWRKSFHKCFPTTYDLELFNSKVDHFFYWFSDAWVRCHPTIHWYSNLHSPQLSSHSSKSFNIFSTHLHNLGAHTYSACMLLSKWSTCIIKC